jgi:hypothetical protein
MVVFRTAPDTTMMPMPGIIGPRMNQETALSHDVVDEQVHRQPQDPARVSCNECGFRWYGLTAVHGLSIIGRCPRCSGTLRFSERAPTKPVALAGAEFEVQVREDADDAELPEAAPRARRAPAPMTAPAGLAAPSRVLGLPLSWDR